MFDYVRTQEDSETAGAAKADHEKERLLAENQCLQMVINQIIVYAPFDWFLFSFGAVKIVGQQGEQNVLLCIP